MRWLLAALALAVGAPVAAQQAASPAATPDSASVGAVMKLLDASDFERTLDMMFEPMGPIFAKAVIGGVQGNAEAKQITDRLIEEGDGGLDRLTAILSEEFLRSMRAQYPALKANAAREYAASFTLAELEEVLRFQQSPAGAKMLRLMPEMQRKLAASGQKLGETAGQQAGRAGFERALREMLPQRKPARS